LPAQEKANEGIVRIARELGRPMVGTGDVHYLRREDYHHHAALLCVQTKSTLAQPKINFETNEFFLRSNDEMAAAFADWPEAIAAYSLEITDVDPLRYGLLFERFLNPERVSMPDIDIDFSVRGRDRVIRYVTEKYGQESVAQIVTFGKMFPRAATRDAARVLGHDYGAGDRLAKLIPDPVMGRPPSFEECLKPGQPLHAEVERDADAKQIVDV